MIFRQLFESSSSTYTYLIGCEETGQTALIDPVLETVERDLNEIKALGLELSFSIDTHIHADHLTSARKLKAFTNSQIAFPSVEKPSCADIGLTEGVEFKVGNVVIHPLFTPGHTSHHHAYLIDDSINKMLFSGDALLIDACGRTDFQSGDAATLYDSIHNKFFILPEDTLVYPGHDYAGRFVSTIAQEKKRNPRLGDNRSREEFVKIMNDLDLPYPRKIDFAVPGNEICGECPPNVPNELRSPCEIHDQG